MGFRGLSSLVIVFFILMLLFGTKRIREMGNDLAIAIRNFRKGLQEEQADSKDLQEVAVASDPKRDESPSKEGA